MKKSLFVVLAAVIAGVAASLTIDEGECSGIPAGQDCARHLDSKKESDAVHRQQDVVLIDQAINRLYQDVVLSQVPADLPRGPLNFGFQKGLFEENMHYNFVGNGFQQFLRSKSVPDNDMFVTAFVLESFFDVWLFGYNLTSTLPPSPGDATAVTVSVNDTLASMALASIMTAQDQNNLRTYPSFGFWRQKAVTNGNITYYVTDPTNLNGLADLANLMIALAEAFMPSMKKVLEAAAAFVAQLVQFFGIPSDADDTCVTLAMHHYFSRIPSNLLPETNKIFVDDFLGSNDIGQTFLKLRDFAYCPSSSDENRNTIDPRSYYWARDYINKLEANESIQCIISTWFQDLSKNNDIVRGKAFGPRLPNQIPVIDPTVIISVIYSMVVDLLYPSPKKSTDWLSADGMREFFLRNVDFVSHVLQNQHNQTRPDLMRPFYPAKLNAIYYAGRVLNVLQSYRATHGKFPAQHDALLSQVYNVLFASSQVLVQEVIQDAGGIHHRTECWPSRQFAESFPQDACIEDFLGVNDTVKLNLLAPDHDDVPDPHFQDRFFTTAMALNAMLNIYTESRPFNSRDEGVSPLGPQPVEKVLWLQSTPQSVKDLVASFASFVTHASTTYYGQTSFENVFFAAGFYFEDQKVFYYPSNYKMDIVANTTIDCDTANSSHLTSNQFTVVFGTQGYINDDDYARMMSAGCAGRSTPTVFYGFNGNKTANQSAPWIYWSSPPLSKGLAMQSLAKFRQLII